MNDAYREAVDYEPVSELTAPLAAVSREAAPQRDLHHREATRREQKELFKVLRRDIVEFNAETAEYELKYYGSDSPNSEKRVPLKELKTDHSLDDDEFKWSYAWFCMNILAVMCFLPLSREYAGLFFGDVNFDLVSADWKILVAETMVVGVVGLLLAIYFALVRLKLIANFVGIDAMWTNAIDQIFSQDVRVRMDGVRDCLLKFRQFIKWRRWANFFLGIFQPAAAIFVLIGTFAAHSVGLLDPEEMVFIVLFSAGLVLTILWFRAQREEHTDWRDPTVQVCVAMAEMHRRYVESKIMNEGRGARQS